MVSAGKRTNKAAAIVVIVALAASALGGAYALQDYKQHKGNEQGGPETVYDARLIEDFEEFAGWSVEDGEIKKNVSVTNLGRASGGSGDVYVRIVLKEYMEIGSIAYIETDKRYMLDEEGKFVVYQNLAAAMLATAPGGKYSGHKYKFLKDVVTKTEGYFIETKDDDSDGQMGKFVVTGFTSGTATPVIPGSVRADNTNHYAHSSQECDYPIHTYTGADLETREYVDMYFNGPDIIPLSNWNGKALAKWIIDDSAANASEGWAYWGQPLAAGGDTTALFLKGVELIKQPEGSFYYVIHTDMQAISLDELTSGKVADWGSVGEQLIANAPSATWDGATPISVVVGESVYSPGVTIGPADAAQTPLFWSSSSPSIATVDSNGVVTGHSPGRVTITVMAPNGAKASYNLDVLSTPAIPPNSIVISGGNREMEVDSVAVLSCTTDPLNNEYPRTWFSSNPLVASVDAAGALRALSPGTAYITVSAGTAVSPAITVNVIPKTAVPPTSISIVESSQTIAVGQELTLSCTTVPAGNNYARIWASSAPASVSVIPTGSPSGTMATVRGLAVGTSNITVSTGTAISAPITITVVAGNIPATDLTISGGDRTVPVGGAIEVSCTLAPPNSTERPVWSSSSNTTATVTNAATGPNLSTTVTGVAPGKITLSVKAGAITKSIQVTVQPGATLPVKTPNDGAGYKPVYNSDALEGDGYYGTVYYPNLDNPLWNNVIHYGSIHLEDIISDGNYEGVAISPVESRFSGSFKIENDKHGKPSIIYSYFPSEQEYRNWPSNGGDINIKAQVVLTRGAHTATVTLNLYYWDTTMTIIL